MKSPDSCPLLHLQLFNRNHSIKCQYNVMTSEINMIWVILGHIGACGCVTSLCIYLKCSQMFVCRWNAAARLVVTPAAAAWHTADQSEARVNWHLTNQRPVSGQRGSQGWSVVTADTAEAGERHWDCSYHLILADKVWRLGRADHGHGGITHHTPEYDKCSVIQTPHHVSMVQVAN